MSSVMTAGPLLTGSMHSLRRFSVVEYDQLTEIGILTDEDKVELLEGWVVLKMPRNPPHDGTIQMILKRLGRRIPRGWDARGQSAITLSGSKPEPDIAVVRGDEATYLSRHPGAADIGLLIEVSDTSLDRDRIDKGRIYARDDIPIYWIVNLVDRQLEVRTQPGVIAGEPAYTQVQILHAGDSVPFILDGGLVVNIPVSELLP